MSVPVGEMEAAGKVMPAGGYRIAISINGSAHTVFTVLLGAGTRARSAASRA